MNVFKLISFCLLIQSFESLSQESYIGNYCNVPQDQNNITDIIQRCYTFNEDMTFTEEIRLDIGLIYTGKYEVVKNEISLFYDDNTDKNITLEITKHTKEKLVFKYKYSNRRKKTFRYYKNKKVF